MEEKIYIPIINRSEIHKVFIENIMVIEQKLRKIIIYTDTEEKRYSRYGKLDEIVMFLDDRFFRCHHSYLINMKKVVKMREQTIFFEGGVQVAIGREKFHVAKQKFAGFMIQETSAKKLLARSVRI